MGGTIEELQTRMSRQEFMDWIAFDRLSPLGDDRADLHAGIIASTVANAHRHRGRAYKPADFMPDYGRPKPTGEELRQKLVAFAQFHNAAIRAKKARGF